MNWLDDLRGIREVVDADDIAYPNRKRIRFIGGAVVTDDPDSDTTDVEVGGASTTWAEVLANGATTGGIGITIDAGVFIQAEPGANWFGSNLLGGGLSTGQYKIAAGNAKSGSGANGITIVLSPGNGDGAGVRGTVDVDGARIVGAAAVTGSSVSHENVARVLGLAEVNHGSMGETETIDWSANGAHRGTLDSATCTLTFTSPGGVTLRIVLKIIQDATGGRAIAHPASVKNVAAGSVGGVSLVTTANTTTVIAYYFDGTNYWAELICTGVA